MSLSPSQRIALIKVIAKRLGKESWSLIDVTLTQFGLPTVGTWSGTTEGYVLEHAQSAPDQSLIDLAQHVGYNFEQTAVPGVDPPFWRKDMLRLFLRLKRFSRPSCKNCSLSMESLHLLHITTLSQHWNGRRR
jgi:hypothetical protein